MFSFSIENSLTYLTDEAKDFTVLGSCFCSFRCESRDDTTTRLNVHVKESVYDSQLSSFPARLFSSKGNNMVCSKSC